MEPSRKPSAVRGYSRAFAAAALRRQDWSPSNRKLVEYWLSLWDGDALPARASFSPQAVRELLPGIMIMEIVPGTSVTARLVGTALVTAFGMDFTGMDMLALSPADSRSTRLFRNTQVAEGAASLCLRHVQSRLGEAVTSQEIQLPFADFTPDGARLVLFHTSWRPEFVEPGIANLRRTLELPVDWHIIPLRPE